MALILLLASLSPFTESAYADFVIHAGPASMGIGGSNPLSIPPTDPLDYEFVWLTDSEKEWSFGLSPGVFYGQRYTFADHFTYVSLGGGIVNEFNGLGPGIYTAFGYDYCDWFCFNIEYKQALGFTTKNILSPYALRVGVTIEY
ncbi:MAG: hypothetical protein KA436_04455 [Oligoflexales bacterium]|nr:hypothetical protein [Oligoflexales bacterium]